MQLYETHRPKTLDAVLGQPRAVKTIARFIQKSVGGRAFWISGPSGTGKTTLARIIAASIADDLYVQEFDCADQITVSVLDKIEADMQYKGFGRGGKCFIIEESHGLRKASIRRLLGLLERLPDYVCFVFTTTKQGESKLFEDSIDASPLLSRCVNIELTNQGLAKVFAEHCRRIATAHDLNGRPLSAYLRLAADHHNNCRSMLMAVESGNMLS